MVEAVRSDDTRLLTICEVGEYLSLSKGAVYNLLRSHKLASIHIGRARRVPMGEIRRYVREALARAT